MYFYGLLLLNVIVTLYLINLLILLEIEISYL